MSGGTGEESSCVPPPGSGVQKRATAGEPRTVCARRAADGPGDSDIEYVQYRDEGDMPGIISLIEKDLSEPYSIFTYRYFINCWQGLCFMAQMDGTNEGTFVGAIVCKLDTHRSRNTSRGYIAMLAVEKSIRGKGIGSTLVRLCLQRMQELGADECVLETEVTNKAALGLYRNMGFVKEKRLHKYYLNGNDAFRLKFLFKLPEGFDAGLGCLGPLSNGRSTSEETPLRDGQGGLPAFSEQEEDVAAHDEQN
eukprot:gnl/TRDRNA2_/TRDRNA2_184376_c0_seq1.p1 gnl/TRDRNA2_/TRDRNA2_184376_c0~~gnl/TRDRNA2_/TRDRNA2_184376_c0_seq1.p1  ORF type:complete len:251 (-),score=51.74 gnl/TRDRNA2_/TRDRNA2_184376_c0_seq1:196-948(-)